MDSKGFPLISDNTLEATVKLVFQLTTLQVSLNSLAIVLICWIQVWLVYRKLMRRLSTWVNLLPLNFSHSSKSSIATGTENCILRILKILVSKDCWKTLNEPSIIASESHQSLKRYKRSEPYWHQLQLVRVTKASKGTRDLNHIGSCIV
jgi:hypothetical protein